MSSARRLMAIVALLVAVLIGGIGGYAYAQAKPSFSSGHVFSGNEIGFRVDGMIYGKPARATLLIKIDGEWREFQPNIDVTPLAK
jgi:hypothetical protein